MSYKFNLDHTLSLAKIHDMITIDIKPETHCAIVGEDVELTGNLRFSGSYLTTELGESAFEGTIPLDITLPYNGGNPEISPEIIGFDYKIGDRDALTLQLEMTLRGYGLDSLHTEAVNAVVEPLTPEQSFDALEAVIEPFGTERDAVVPEEVPYSPLIDLYHRELVNNAPVIITEESVSTTAVLDTEDAPASNLRITEKAAAIMEELFSGKSDVDVDDSLEEMQAEEVTAEEGFKDFNDSKGLDTVASQFSDGLTRVKMVYVNEDAASLDDVLTRFDATADDVWNLNSLNDEVAAGDCVMLRYEKNV